jgi:hypothetical protein
VQHIAPTCLPNKGEDFTGKTATAIGWGKLDENDPVHSDLLRQVDLPIISNILCQVDYGPWVNECHMCVDTFFGQKVQHHMCILLYRYYIYNCTRLRPKHSLAGLWKLGFYAVNNTLLGKI